MSPNNYRYHKEDLSNSVDSRVSPTQLAMNTGNLSLEFSHCKTVVLFFHK